MSRFWSKTFACITLVAFITQACASAPDGFTPLSRTNSVVQLREGLTVSARPTDLTQEFGLQLGALPAETLTTEATGAAARTALPTGLTLASNLFTLATNGSAPTQLFVSASAPFGTDPLALDMYGWDGTAWSFIPAQVRGQSRVASVTRLPQAVGLFTSAASVPLVGTLIEPGEAADTAFNAQLLGGVVVNADGSLGGALPNVTLASKMAAYPVVRPAGVVSAAMLSAAVAQQLASFATSASYRGLVLDFGALTVDTATAFTQFASALSGQLHTQKQVLWVRVTTPTPQGSGANPDFNTLGYQWAELGQQVDALILPLPLNPSALENGETTALLNWALGQANRQHILLSFSARHTAGIGTQFEWLDNATALSLLGQATTAEALPAELFPGQSVTFTLSGSAQQLAYDLQALAVRFTANGKTVWLTSAETLQARLQYAAHYRLGGVIVSQLADGETSTAPTLAAYQSNQLPKPTGSQAQLAWTVTENGQVVAQNTTQPDQPFVFRPVKAGDYQVAAQLQASTNTELGTVPLKVAEVVATPAPTPTVVVGTVPSNSTPNPTNPNPTAKPPTGGGGFVPPPPVANGAFELGGQVPGYIGHGALMQQAGMKWVKMQAFNGQDASGSIAAAHGAGFKVLISAIGNVSRGADPSYWPEYAAWVAGIAAQGADAVEIWNEANLDRDWPTGQISGVTYTEVLKQAYAAIKAANGNTIVISGAPAPTGAEGAFPGRVMNDNNFIAQMAAAGAANYMDCVGIHYNEGVVSPNQASGDPRDNFYSRYYPSMVDLYYGTFGGSRQLCFTEVGYLTGEGFSTPLPSFFGWAGDNTVAEQAQWLAEAASLSAASGKVRMMIIFNVDFTVWGDDPQAGFAILRPDGSCPACNALDAVMP